MHLGLPEPRIIQSGLESRTAREKPDSGKTGGYKDRGYSVHLIPGTRWPLGKIKVRKHSIPSDSSYLYLT